VQSQSGGILYVPSDNFQKLKRTIRMFQKLERTIRIPAREKPGMNASAQKTEQLCSSFQVNLRAYRFHPLFKHIHKKIQVRQMRQCNAEGWDCKGYKMEMKRKCPSGSLNCQKSSQHSGYQESRQKISASVLRR